MKNFLPIVLLILLLVAVGFGIYSFRKSSGLEDSYVAEKGRVEALLGDLAQERIERGIDQKVLSQKIDSLQELYDASTVRVKVSDKKYADLLIAYRASTSGSDSVPVADCDEVIEAADVLITDLGTSLELCDSISSTKSLLINSLTLDNASYSRSLSELSAFSANQNKMLESYRKKQSSWWGKNKLWVGFLSGVVVTSVVVTTVKK